LGLSIRNGVNPIKLISKPTHGIIQGEEEVSRIVPNLRLRI
jgi:hypothetical protein